MVRLGRSWIHARVLLAFVLLLMLLGATRMQLFFDRIEMRVATSALDQEEKGEKNVAEDVAEKTTVADKRGSSVKRAEGRKEWENGNSVFTRLTADDAAGEVSALQRSPDHNRRQKANHTDYIAVPRPAKCDIADGVWTPSKPRVDLARERADDFLWCPYVDPRQACRRWPKHRDWGIELRAENTSYHTYRWTPRVRACPPVPPFTRARMCRWQPFRSPVAAAAAAVSARCGASFPWLVWTRASQPARRCGWRTRTASRAR
jgi:hypothetical protein